LTSTRVVYNQSRRDGIIVEITQTSKPGANAGFFNPNILHAPEYNIIQAKRQPSFKEIAFPMDIQERQQVQTILFKKT